MFKKSEAEQGDLFNSVGSRLSKRAQREMSKQSAWHNVFLRDVTMQIDESIFSVLYDDAKGRPNSSIRVLVSMMILKSGFGWSDKELFAQCLFNIQVRAALGFVNLNSEPPVDSTYYLFRQQVVQYEKESGISLFRKCFSHVTKEQVLAYGVNGEKIRIDSKLLYSNIRRSNRLETILEGVRHFIKGKNLSKMREGLTINEYRILKQLQEKTVSNILYPLRREEEQTLLKRLGKIIDYILLRYKSESETQSYQLLARLFNDHYEVKSDDSDGDRGPQLRDNKDLSAEQLQSVHDPDATFAQKGKGANRVQVKGYHSSIVETCHEDNQINLITDVSLQPAHVKENEFLQDHIQSHESICQTSTTDKAVTKTVIVDGGYDSKANRAFFHQKNQPNLILKKCKGNLPRYYITKTKSGKYIAYDKKEDKSRPITKAKNCGKHVIVNEDEKPIRYLNEEEFQNNIILTKILSNYCPEEFRRRANVEATIHQMHHKRSGNKSRYRGLERNAIDQFVSAMWVNCERIAVFALILINSCLRILWIAPQQKRFISRKSMTPNFQ